MPRWRVALDLGVKLFAFALGSVAASAEVWQPSEAQTQIWPNTPPDAQPLPGPESIVTTTRLIAGRHYRAILNVSQPSMTIYRPTGTNSGAAVVVFPGGGFEALAIDLEGTEVCDWLTAKGITCVLLKYRVPSVPYDWRCNCYPDGFATSKLALQDAQRTIGLVRHHAKAWGIDPHKIGVLGFSAGGFLAAEISTRYQQRLYTPVDDADKESARPDFAVLIYPGRLATGNDMLNPNAPVSSETPPSFLVHTEDDKYGVKHSLVYYAALKKAGVLAEMHLYAEGGHAFGLRPTTFPITHWPELAEKWLHSIGILSGNAEPEPD